MADWPTGRLLSTASRLIEHAWHEALEKQGLTHAGLIVLALVHEQPRTQSELAAGARVENQTMSRTLERLEREGFVSRSKDPGDRRRHIVTPTPAGIEAWERARDLEARFMPEVENGEQFRESLLAIIAASAANRWNA